MNAPKGVRYLKTLLIISASALLLSVGLYLSFFRGGLSINSEDWASFGKYLSGVASAINVFIFIFVSLLLKNIESQLRNRESKVNRESELFSRFLDSYQSLTKTVINFKSVLATTDLAIEDEKEQFKGLLLDSFKEYSYLESIFLSYLSDDLKEPQIASIREDYSILYESILDMKDNEVISNNVATLLKSIKEFEENLHQIITSVKNLRANYERD